MPAPSLVVSRGDGRCPLGDDVGDRLQPPQRAGFRRCVVVRVASSVCPPLQRVTMKQSGFVIPVAIAAASGWSIAWSAPPSEHSPLSSFQFHHQCDFSSLRQQCNHRLGHDNFRCQQALARVFKTRSVSRLLIKNDPKSLSLMTSFDTLYSKVVNAQGMDAPTSQEQQKTGLQPC